MKKSFLQLAIFSLSLCACNNVAAQNIYTYAGTTTGGGGYSGDGSFATLAELTGPTGLVTTSTGIVYICDSRNFVVRKVDASGIITTVAGNNTPGYSGDGAAATNAQLNPTAIAVDKYGDLLITDGTNNVVRMVNTSGIISTIAGTSTGGYSGDGAAASLAQVNRPAGIVTDTAGNIYIADSRNFVVRKINTSGIITTIAGVGGTAGFSGDGGAATAANFARPAGLAIKNDGTLYISDATNNDVRVVSPSGTINTFAGTATAGYTGDGGAASAATFTGPVGIALDASGNLYIADSRNNVVRKVNASNIISTYAGNGNPGYSGDGGVATHAQMTNSSWVAVEASGNVYISDNVNNVVRRVGAAVRSIAIASNHGDTVCAGVTTHFTATVFADTTPHYQWQVNGINTGSDSAGFTYTGLVSGDVIDCYLTNSAGGTDLAISNALTVDTLPIVGTITGITTICVGSSSFFRDSTGTGGGAGGFGGTWTLSDTTVAHFGTFPPGIVTALTPGTDTIIYTNSNICGTLSTRAVITVTTNPNGPITGPDTLCSRATATYTETTTGGTWNVQPRGAGFIDASGNFTAGRTRGPGGYVFITYGTSPSCVSIDSVYIDSIPRIMPITGPTTVNTLFTITLTDGTPGGTWSSADTTIATVSSTGVVYGVAVGTVGISYFITNALGCTGFFIDTITVVSASGIQTINKNSQFNVVPNPTTGNVNLVWSGFTPGNGIITISDVTGRELYKNETFVVAPSGQSSIDITSFKTGIYLVSFRCGNDYFYTKIVKE